MTPLAVLAPETACTARRSRRDARDDCLARRRTKVARRFPGPVALLPELERMDVLPCHDPDRARFLAAIEDPLDTDDSGPALCQRLTRVTVSSSRFWVTAL